MSWRITTFAEVRLIPKPPALVDRRNTNIPISVLNWSIRCILQNTRKHTSGLGENTACAPELNTEVMMIFWKGGQWCCKAAQKYRCYAERKRGPTVLSSDQRNILSDRSIAKNGKRLGTRFWMIVEYKEQVEGRLKYMKQIGGREEFSFMTIFCTNCTHKGSNGLQLYVGNHTTARMTIFLKQRKEHLKNFLKKSWNRKQQKSSTAQIQEKHCNIFSCEGQSKWSVLEKQKGLLRLV